MTQLQKNKQWEEAQRKEGTDLRTSADGRYLNRKTAVAWTKWYSQGKQSN